MKRALAELSTLNKVHKPPPHTHIPKRAIPGQKGSIITTGTIKKPLRTASTNGNHTWNARRARRVPPLWAKPLNPAPPPAPCSPKTIKNPFRTASTNGNHTGKATRARAELSTSDKAHKPSPTPTLISPTARKGLSPG